MNIVKRGANRITKQIDLDQKN